MSREPRFLYQLAIYDTTQNNVRVFEREGWGDSAESVAEDIEGWHDDIIEDVQAHIDEGE